MFVDKIKKVAEFGMQLLFPARCLGCRRTGEYVCAPCLADLEPPAENACSTCQTAIKAGSVCAMCEYGDFIYDTINAVFQMNGTARNLVHALKYEDLRALAPKMGEIMAEYIATRDLQTDVLMPLPIHPKRMRQRGYNQSALLGKVVADHLQIAFDDTTLVRIKHTPPQVALKVLEERINSMRGAFRCDTDLDGKNVLLLDDVVTSGSTINEATVALKNAGAGSVDVLAFARGGW